MHPNPSFHSHEHAKDIALVRDRGFGTLMVNGDPVPMVAHVPVLLPEDGRKVLIHLVRSNPIARALKTPLPARIAVTGPDAYISPDWYGVVDQVPTWNYVAVQITGVLELLPHAQMREVLDTQTAHYDNLVGGRLAFHSRRQGNDHFAWTLVLHPCEQGRQTNLVRS